MALENSETLLAVYCPR